MVGIGLIVTKQTVPLSSDYRVLRSVFLFVFFFFSRSYSYLDCIGFFPHSEGVWLISGADGNEFELIVLILRYAAEITFVIIEQISSGSIGSVRALIFVN